MKRLIPFFIIISVLLASCQYAPTNEPSTNSDELIKAVWVSCYDYTSAADKNENDYRKITDEMFANIKNCGFNTAFVHLRAFGDAFYESDIFPYSSYIAGEEGADLPFDPFEILLESAKEYSVSVHGWINPFRISYNNNPELLSSNNPAKIILDSGNADGDVCIIENGIFLNPAGTYAQKLVLDGIREIINKYSISGIHIDDYFYPSIDPAIDAKQYSQYLLKGGKLPLNEWRTENVTAFTAGLYSAVKAVNPQLTVSISPCAISETNKNELYADCELWLRQKGFADIIIPQIYFGFEHEKNDFVKLAKEWAELPRHSEVKLVCGIAAYKCSFADEYAGKGEKEWIANTDILTRQLEYISADRSYSGFAVFSYSDLIRENCKNEIDGIKSLLKNGENK